VSTVQDIERAIAKLTAKELSQLRAFIWDREIERNTAGGRLDYLASESIEEYRSGRARPL